MAFDERPRRFAAHYTPVAEACGCDFPTTGQVIVSSDLDGVHLEASEHTKLGATVAARVRALLV
jgi:hypothetical protein